MRIFYHQASLTKSWNGPVQLLLMGKSLILQATPHWKKHNKWTIHSPILLMVVVSNLRLSFYQKRLDQTSQWQCGTLRIPLELFAKSLWDLQVMKDFVCFPQRKYTDCGSHVYDKITSADWFYEAFNNSPATDSGMLWIWSGCLFVGIGNFDDSSNTDHLMKEQTQSILSYKLY